MEVLFNVSRRRQMSSSFRAIFCFSLCMYDLLGNIVRFFFLRQCAHFEHANTSTQSWINVEPKRKCTFTRLTFVNSCEWNRRNGANASTWKCMEKDTWTFSMRPYSYGIWQQTFGPFDLFELRTINIRNLYAEFVFEACKMWMCLCRVSHI